MINLLDTSGAETSLDFDQLTQLDGREYLMRFFWSDREACWYVNIADQDGNALALGVKLVVGWPLLRRFRDPRLPPGLLLVQDTSGANQEIREPSELAANGRCPLVYFTADDEALQVTATAAAAASGTFGGIPIGFGGGGGG